MEALWRGAGAGFSGVGGVGFGYRDRCRRECALFFISRVKENMIYDWIQGVPVDATDARDARSHGVVADRRICTREGNLLRSVRHPDPVGGESYEFLADVMDLLAGAGPGDSGVCLGVTPACPRPLPP